MPRSVPNYLTIDPATGKVGAQFTGTISGRGVVLPTGGAGYALPEGGPVTADEASYEWRRIVVPGSDVPSGDLRGFLYFDDGGELKLHAKGNSPTGGIHFGQITAEVTNDTLGDVNAIRKSVLRDDGTSDFQFGQLQVITYAATAADTGDVGFTLAKPSTVLFIANGSGYNGGTANAFINILFDGTVRFSLGLYFNTSNVHMDMGTRGIVLTGVAAGAHTMRMQPGGFVARDVNDYNNMIVLAIPTQ